MDPARRLREKIAQRELTTGLLVIDHLWTDIVEIALRSEIDYLIVDMEHGSTTTHMVGEVCAAGRRAGLPILIRPRSNDYATIRLAADLGPCGFLLASVDSAADLDVVRDALYLPPRGRRRPGGLGNRWVGDLSQTTWKAEVEDHFIVLPQIETRIGLSNLTAIANHELTTAMAIGPYDLSAELGVCGEMNSPVLRESLMTIRAAADAVGKATWMIGSNAAGLVADGWKFICIGEPTWILISALQDKVAEARETLDR
ncbi:MAG: aldolase/citrate lyase family protein [Planctomycetota bacterium]